MNGYALAGTWVVMWAVIFSTPAAVVWALATKRGRR